MPAPETFLLSVARRHMATDFELEVVVEPSNRRAAESVLAEAHSTIAALEDELSEFREESVVARLNRSPVGEWIEAGRDSLALLSLSRGLSERTGGAFDPFSKSEGPATFADLEIDAAGGRVRRLREGVRIGFGAIGKGYALDRVRELLERQGFVDYRLGCGGSSWIFGGFSATGDAWEISWAWDRDVDGDLVGQRYRLRAGRPAAIGVSGTLEQGNHFLRGGKRVEDRVKSAFWCGLSAAEADACSTALLVGAAEEGEDFLTRLRDDVVRPCFAYVDNEGTMVYNRDFETHFLREGRIG
jgi:thiamine biosynthesis lipoprotein